MDLIDRFRAERVLAHEVLFAHRRERRSCSAQGDMIDFLHGGDEAGLVLGFRGLAKSTTAEEALIIKACEGTIRNAVVFSRTKELAAERLDAIAHELETNDVLAEVYGDPVSSASWSSYKLVLSNGVALQARGRGQSMRGTKHRQWRPDFALFDDLEEREEAQDEEFQRQTLSWIMSTALPAMARDYQARMLATPFHPKCVALRLKNEAGWPTRVYPIERIGATGERVATWPDGFSLEKIDKLKAEFARLGLMTEYTQEYMCEAEVESEKTFLDRWVVVDNTLTRTWEGVWAFIDPARTAGGNAGTGIAVWSWVGTRLIVWECCQKYLKPDEIIAEVFRIDEQYKPILIGIEEDGLSEFLRQPLRQEIVKRGNLFVPVKPMQAPRVRSKLSFIGGLQPFYKAGDIVWAKEHPDLRIQQNAFRPGISHRTRIDALNALAYAPEMRTGSLVYPDFSPARHLTMDETIPRYGGSCYLAINASAGTTAAVLLQHGGMGLRVLWDDYVEAPAMECLSEIVIKARILLGAEPQLIAAPAHFDRFHNHGLIQAASRLPAQVSHGTAPEIGRAEIMAAMQRALRGLPSFTVSIRARWTLASLQGGYAREGIGLMGPKRIGPLNDGQVADGVFKLVMEALESFAGLLAVQGSTGEQESDINFAYRQDGSRYRTAMPRR